MAFLQYCVFGEVSDENLNSSFLRFLSNDESKIISSIFKEDNVREIIQMEEFADFLEQFKCRSLVTEENAKSIVTEIARQELVQRPHLMAVSWQEVFQDLKICKNFQMNKQ